MIFPRLKFFFLKFLKLVAKINEKLKKEEVPFKLGFKNNFEVIAIQGVNFKVLENFDYLLFFFQKIEQNLVVLDAFVGKNIFNGIFDLIV